MHDGTVTASSAGLGKGSEFVVRLPTTVDHPRQELPPLMTDATAMIPLRVLVVEDNLDAAESLAMLLRMRGHDLHLAHDGLKAVAVAATLQPDVILLDIGLPSLNDYAVAQRIREQRADRRPILVALTGLGQDEDRHRSEAAGFDAHLVKPVNDTALMTLLARLVVGAPESHG